MMKENSLPLYLCLLLAMIPVIGIDIPKVVAILPALTGTIFFIIYKFWLKQNIKISKPAACLAIIIFLLSLTSLLWADDFKTSLRQTLQFLAILPFSVLLISLASSLSASQFSKYFHYVAYGVLLGIGVIIFEILSGGIFFNLIRGNPFNIAPPIFEYNRGAVLLTLCSFSAMAILKHHIPHKLSPLILFIPLGIALSLSVCQSAQLMIFVGFFFFFLFPYQQKYAWLGLKIIILSVMLTMPFFISYIYEHYAGIIQNMPMMSSAYAGHRLEIWDYVSRYALERPLTGYGADVTRTITDFDSKRMFLDGNTVTHPHNFIIQIWIEFGLIGIMIAMGLMYQFLTLIEKNYTTAQQKIILPALVCALVSASVSYGMWQGMWLGVLFFTASLTILTCKYITKETS